MTPKELIKQELKRYEEREKNKESSYVCDNPYTDEGLCGGNVRFNKEFKCWCCDKCGVVVTEEHKNKLSRAY